MENKLRPKDALGVSVFFFLLTLVATFPLILGLQKSVYGPFYNTDIRGGLWNLWWAKYALTHGVSYEFCPFLAAPYGLDLSQQPISWIVKSVMAVFLSFSNPVLCFNLLMFLSFILCGLFTFNLAYFLTKDRIAAVLAAFIFTFSPYHLNKAMEFNFFFIANWLVLYVWAVIKLKENTCWRHIFVASLAFALTSAFNPYYGFFALVFTLGFVCFLLFCQRNLRKGMTFIAGLAGVFSAAVLLNAPTVILVGKNIFYPETGPLYRASLGYVRSFDYLISQSARPLSYLLPASTHPFFGGLTRKMFGSIFYGRGSIEQTLYLGWIPLILAYLTFRQWRHRRGHPTQYPAWRSSDENFYVGFFIFLAWMGFIFSLPPHVDLGIFKIYFPSFFIYKFLPMFRAYARFGVVVMLCVSILAAYGIKLILEGLVEKRQKFILASLIFLVISFEFTNVLPWRVTDVTKGIPPVYKWLAAEKGDFIIAEYPMAMVSPGEAQENYDYLTGQMTHEKRMINGALYGTRAFEVRKEILKAADSKTPHILKALGVRYLIFHSDLYRKGKYPEAVEVIGEVPDLEKIGGYKLIKTFGPDQVFEVTAEPIVSGEILKKIGEIHAQEN